MIDLGPKFGYLNLSSKAYKSDVFCDAVVANREISELEDMELKFANSLPCESEM